MGFQEAWELNLTQEQTLRDFQGFESKIFSGTFVILDNLVDDICHTVFLEAVFGRAMIFENKRTCMIDDFTLHFIIWKAGSGHEVMKKLREEV